MRRSPRPGKPGANPDCNRAHDPGFSRHQHHRPGVAPAPWTVRTGVPVRARRLNRLCVSGNIYAEYEEVISRPRLQRPDDVITSTLQAIREKGFWVRPMETVRACSDPDDDIFLECAQAAQADYLVTGNLKHFPASWAGARIVTPRWLLDSLLAERNQEPKS